MSTITAAAAPGGLRGLWDRQLPHYPDTARRMSYLGITILATITLYYALFVQGAVAPQIIAEYHFSFTQFVGIVRSAPRSGRSRRWPPGWRTAGAARTWWSTDWC